MCGRAVRKTPTGNLARHFHATAATELPPSYNVAPTQDLALVRRLPGGEQRELIAVRWGLIPPWVKDDGKAPMHFINAKAETVHEKRSFKGPFKQRRGLVVLDGFYEWLREDPKKKRPFLIQQKSGAPLAIAALWEHNPAYDLDSATVLTTTPNALLAQIHDRMPVILTSEDEQSVWLDPESDEQALRKLLRPCPPELLEMFEVSTRVNSVKHDDEECTRPLPLPQPLPHPHHPHPHPHPQPPE